jgi:hypothetical protein
MLNKRSLFVTATLASFSLLGASAAKADEDAQCYTLASLHGTYVVVTSYTGDIAAAFGVRQLDGEGNLTGTFTLNEPEAGSTTGGRTIVTGTQMGTYTVNCDGTGVITRVVKASNGVTGTQQDDFVITRAIRVHGHLLATAIHDIERTASLLVPGGLLVTRDYTLRPDPSREEEQGQ